MAQYFFVRLELQTEAVYGLGILIGQQPILVESESPEPLLLYPNFILNFYVTMNVNLNPLGTYVGVKGWLKVPL